MPASIALIVALGVTVVGLLVTSRRMEALFLR